MLSPWAGTLPLRQTFGAGAPSILLTLSLPEGCGIRRIRPYGDSHGSLSETPLDAFRPVPAGTHTGQWACPYLRWYDTATCSCCSAAPFPAREEPAG